MIEAIFGFVLVLFTVIFKGVVSLMKVIFKWLSAIFALVGVAFFGGSYLAYVQGIFAQISLLAIAGVACLIIAAILLAVHLRKAKK